MSLRLATSEDRELFLKLCSEFYLKANFKNLSLSLRKLDQLFTTYLESDKTQIIILLSGDTGLLVGTAIPPLFSEETIASEAAWYSQTDNKKQLLLLFRAFEAWSKKVGAKLITRGRQYPASDTSGYYLQEETYMKEV